MRKCLLLAFVCLMAVIAPSQDLWISPQRFFFTIRDIANLHFLVGDKLTGNDWQTNTDSIAQLVLYGPTEGTRKLNPVFRNGIIGLQLSLREEGTHMVVLNGNNNRSVVDAESFNQYLQQEGLEQIGALRQQRGEDRSMGTIYTQYCAKTIFQVGGKITDDCLRPCLLPLDILPEINPYSVPEGIYNEKPAKQKFQVLFNGQPVYNALVRIAYRKTGSSTHMDSVRSNRRGWISIERRSGPVLLTTTYMERNQPDTETQWQAYKASLNFEYSSFFPGKTGR